jgi:hypothetical protein
MGSCTSFRHLRALAVASHLAVLLTVLLAAPFASAQNACSHIFSTPLTAEVMDLKVTELARLKLRLNQDATSGGAPNVLSKKLQADFTSSFHELLQHSGLSEKAFMDLVKKKVAEVQGKVDDLVIDGAQIRTRQESIAPKQRNEIKLKKTSAIPIEWSDKFYSFGVVSAAKELFYVDKTNYKSQKLKSLNINSGKHSLIFDGDIVLAETTVDGKSLMFLDKSWILHILDTQTGTFSHEVKLDTKDVTPRSDFDDFMGIDISPAGDRVALAGNFIVVFDLKTGHKISVTDGKAQWSQYIKWVRFVDNERITFASDTHVFMYDIFLGQRTDVKMNQKGEAVQGVEVSLDRQSISVVTTVNRFTYDLNLNETAHTKSNGQYAQFIRVPTYASLGFEKPAGEKGPRMYEQKSQAEVFDFGKSYDFNNFEDRAFRGHFDASASTLHIIVLESGKFRLDLWEQ